MKINRDFTFTPRSVCFAEGDSTGGDGGGGDAVNVSTSTAATTTAPTTINLTEFAASLDRLGETLGGKLDGLHSTVREGATASQPQPEPVDLETMSRPELVAHIATTVLDAVKAQLTEALAPVTSQLQSLQVDYSTRNVQSEIATLSSQNKDFSDWKPEMVELAKQPQYGSLTITDLYHLARARNPAKTQELTTKYNPPAPRPTRPTFGGLLPTGAGTPGNGAKPLAPREAGIEAYREVQARHSDVLRALEDM